ncbi:MAG TPA: hypothetical protein VF114_06945 [Candidatus Limnocylindria bacterium]
MSADRDVNRIVRSWLDEGVTALPDRVLDAVLDRVPATPQRRAPWWPLLPLRTWNSRMRLVTAAAALALLIAIGGYAVLNAPVVSPGTDGTPTPSASPTATAMPQLHRSEPSMLRAGPYAADTYFEAPFTLTVPSEWTGLEHKSGFALLVKTEGAAPFGSVPNLALLGFYKVNGAFADPCRDEAPLQPAPQGVTGFVAAIQHEVGVDAGPARTTTVGGLPATTFDLTTTIDYENCPNDPASLWTFYDVGSHVFHENNTGGRSRIWLVDVHGTLILINAELTELATDADAQELYRMVDSVRFR